jgi:hypothetical protein
MPDVIETAPPAVDQTGNTTIFWCPTIADISAPKAATEVKTPGKRVTYSFTPGGFNATGDQEVNKDERLTLEQALESFGKTIRGLTLEYVESTDPASAHVILEEGLSGFFVVRTGIPNKTDVAAAQKVTVIPVTLGKQIQLPINGEGKFRTAQKTILTGQVTKATLGA